jgi:hypothetical protein
MLLKKDKSIPDYVRKLQVTVIGTVSLISGEIGAKGYTETRIFCTNKMSIIMHVVAPFMVEIYFLFWQMCLYFAGLCYEMFAPPRIYIL